MFLEELKSLVYFIPAAMLAIPLHEFAHGFVSSKLGDPTPGMQGRLTLNPLSHLDPLGTIALLLFGFGWAKPMQVDPRYYKNPKLGMVLVAFAGPVMNILIAFVFYFIFGIMIKINPPMNAVISYIANFVQYTAMLNLGLAVFNLLPFPPLDGSKLLLAIVPQKIYFKFLKYEKYIYFVLVILMLLGVLTVPLTILRMIIGDAMMLVVSLVLNI